MAIAFIERGKDSLAERHVDYMLETHQGQDDVGATMALVTKPLLSRIRTTIEHTERDCASAPSAAYAAAKNLLQMAAEPVRILKRFLSADDPQLLDTCDAIANTCLHCHYAILRAANDKSSRWDAVECRFNLGGAPSAREERRAQPVTRRRG